MGTVHEPPPSPPPPAFVPQSPEADLTLGEPGRAAKRNSILAAAILGGACMYTALADPSGSAAYPTCPLRAVTGIDCAFCGGLRCTHALLNGDLSRAASHNLLLAITAPLLAYATVQWLLAPWGVRLPAIPLPRWTLPVAVVVLVVFSVVRNLSFGPGPWLYSGD